MEKLFLAVILVGLLVVLSVYLIKDSRRMSKDISDST